MTTNPQQAITAVVRARLARGATPASVKGWLLQLKNATWKANPAMVQFIETALVEIELGPVHTLTCSCCGGSAKGRQWWNRDTGYGLCTKCVPFVSDRQSTPEQLRQSYGIEGVHYFKKEVV